MCATMVGDEPTWVDEGVLGCIDNISLYLVYFLGWTAWLT